MVEAAPPNADPGHPRAAGVLATPFGYAGGVVALGLAYLAAGLLGRTLPTVGPYATLVWPATGIAVGVLFRAGVRLWPGVFLGALLTNLIASPWYVAPGVAVGNTLAPVLAVVLLRSARFDPALGHPRDLRTLLLAGFAGMLVSATGGVGWLAVVGELPAGRWGTAWIIWWLGDAAGVLLVGPVVLAWAAGCWRGRAGPAETAAAVLVQAAVGFLVFDPLGFDGGAFPVGFLPLVLAVWIGLRYPGWVGAVAALAVSLAAVWGTDRGHGPFGAYSAETRMFAAWGYLVTVALVTLTLAAVHAQRDQAAAALAATADDYRALVDTTPAMICRFTPAGVVTFANETLCRFLGRRPDEVVGAAVRSILPDLPVPGTTAESHVHPPDSQISQAGPVRRADGAERWHRWSTRAVPGPDGTVAECHAVGVDLTERKRAEDERQALERKMLEAQRLESLGVLAGGVAHDFNNLLAGILGHAELAATGLPPASPLREHLAAVLDATQRAGGLTRQLLAYSGKGKFLVRPTDLADLVRQDEPLLRASVPKTPQLRFELAENVPPVTADPTQLRQVVLNLVTNAGEAIGDRPGAITVAAAAAELARRDLPDSYLFDPLEAGRYAVLTVADTGGGMDAATLARLFDPFFTTKFAGRGLGMAAVLGIVRAHRGGIRVVSRPGAGTTVSVYLPTSPVEAPKLDPIPASPPQPTRGEPASTPAASDRPVVLLVDDEEAVRRVAQLMLTRLGFEVLPAGDGRAALELFARHRDAVRVVLLDLTMPRMGGAEVLTELRKLSATVPVVLCSGFTQEAVPDSAARAGLTGFLQKPFTLDELRRVMHTATGHQPTR